MFKSGMRRILEKVLRETGYRLVADNLFDWPLRDQEFLEIFRLQATFGWKETTGPKIQRMYMVRNMLLSVGGLDGNWAECGVFNGSTSLVMAEYDLRYRLLQDGARIHLFDSFHGLSQPSEADTGTSMISGDYKVGEEEVRRNLAKYDRFVCHAGWIPRRFPDVENERFSFVHIDVDLYEPVRDSLEFFLPRMVEGGVIVLDDYGCADTPGALQATDELAARYGYGVAALPYGQAFIIAQGKRRN